MAKRFTETTKWEKQWFRQLNTKMKTVWFFLCERCDAAGAWEIDMETLSFYVGEKVEFDEILSNFQNRVINLEDLKKLFIVDFVKFQYGDLSPRCSSHKPILARIEKLRKSKGYPTPYVRGTVPLVEEEEENLKGECEGNFGPTDLLQLWNLKCDALSKVHVFTDVRKKKATAQLKKYPAPEHWDQVLEKWLNSKFCINSWRPDFDDFLNETKRIRTLEGKYDDKELGTIDAKAFEEILNQPRLGIVKDV